MTGSKGKEHKGKPRNFSILSQVPTRPAAVGDRKCLKCWWWMRSAAPSFSPGGVEALLKAPSDDFRARAPPPRLRFFLHLCDCT